jgi:hypothetical protein
VQPHNRVAGLDNVSTKEPGRSPDCDQHLGPEEPIDNTPKTLYCTSLEPKEIT